MGVSSFFSKHFYRKKLKEIEEFFEEASEHTDATVDDNVAQELSTPLLMP